MNPLYVSGFGISLSVDRARLIVRDGFHQPDQIAQVQSIEPRRMRYDSVIIDGHSGNITLDAFKWLMRHGVPLFVLDYNGTLLSSTLPREPVNGPLKIAQTDTYRDPEKRFFIARKLVEAKAQRTLDVLQWLEARYGKSSAVSEVDSAIERLEGCASLPVLMQVEGQIADIYWRYLQQVLPAKLRFVSRMHESHQMNASDPVNCLLNYGYAILESQIRKTLNSVGLEPSVGFLHEARQTKYPLVYDVQEPYRWLVDTTIIECLECERFSRKDFYRMDNYVLRLKPESVRKLMNALRIRFNSTVRYRGKFYTWATLIRLRAQELAGYILGERTEISFEEPKPALYREDTLVVREKILSLTVAEARKRAIRRNTLWYLGQRARTGKPIRIYRKVSKKLA